MAFNTPFKMWKRYEFNGGTADPCIISWPAGIDGPRRDPRPVPPCHRHRADDPGRPRRRGTRDDQGSHPEPDRRCQHARQPRRRVGGVGAEDPVLCDARLPFDLARRLEGRDHPPDIAGWGHFNDDEWELYHTDVDRAELHNLAAEYPDKVRELVNIWFSEAGANGAFPLDDRSAVEILATPRPQLTAPRDRYVYYPDARRVPEWQAVNTRNRSFAIGALVDIPAPGAEGVLFAMGARFGGHALYVKDNRLHYVNSFVGSEEQMVVGSEDIPTGENLILSAAFDKDGQEADGATGRADALPRRPKVGEGRIKTQLGAFAIAGSGLYVGRQDGEPVTEDYPGEPPHRSPAARSTGSRSTSAASPTSTSSAKPR